jgi:diguanylate cyclase (GGDEF)-like protein/PAS domain S-box-containing protein
VSGAGASPASGDEVARLRAERTYLRAVVERAYDILVATDAEGRMTEFSEGASRALGYARDEVIGRPATMLYVDPRARAALIERVRAAGTGAIVDEELAFRRKDGRKILVSLSLAELRDEAGRVIGAVGVAKDVTERKRLERELRRLSVTDKLTGLYNQSHFYELLEIEKERALRLGHPLSLVLFDLDRFKEWNDNAGHAAGDKALRAVGGVVFGAIRKEVDSGFRYGGDEFCVLLPGTEGDGAIAFAERIRAGVEALGLGGITASVGLAAHDPGARARQIVKAADAAMYRAKRAGGNRICLDGRDGIAYARGVGMPALEAPSYALGGDPLDARPRER